MCMIEGADDDGGQWLTAPVSRRAAKQHTCEDCGRKIETGETYTAGCWLMGYGDGVLSLHVCGQCIAAGKWLKIICGGHLYGFGAIGEDLRMHWDEEPDYRSVGLAKLLNGYGRRWKRPHGALFTVETVERWATEGAERTPAHGRH